MARQVVVTGILLVTILSGFYFTESWLMRNYADPVLPSNPHDYESIPDSPRSERFRKEPPREFTPRRQPHIIFIVADDLGFNDVSWHNKDIIMPTLDTLAREGVILEQNYVLPICSPSRTAFMTGVYPHRMGRQHRIIRHLQPSGVSTNYTFMPERLKKLGYKTHLIGKWHLGFCSKEYLPRSRGFDTFYGFHTGSKNYFDAVTNEGIVDLIPGSIMNAGLDFWENENLIEHPAKVHSSELYMQRFEQVAKDHPKDSPLFVFMSLQNVHSPLEVPERYSNMYLNETNPNRRLYLGLVTNMDDIVESMVSSLKTHGLYEDSVIVFTTDNGGAIVDGGSNKPLKGSKNTFYEGGTRGVGFVHSTLLRKTQYKNYKMIHAVDWLPTFVHLAGGTVDFPTDGINQWRVLSEDGDQMRNSFVYNIDEKYPFRAAIRVGDWKLLWQHPGRPNATFPEGNDHYSDEAKEALKTRRPHYLYNIRVDPNEDTNLNAYYPEIVRTLQQQIEGRLGEVFPGDDPPDSVFGAEWIKTHHYDAGWCEPR